MKADILDLEGKPIGKIDLPEIFEEPVRTDLIQRAVVSSWSKGRQPYGKDSMAGKRTSAHYHGYRRHRYAMMNREMARLPRLHGKTVPFLYFHAMFVPHAVKGRRAHPPLVAKVYDQMMNDKERKKAIRSAIAATTVKDIVAARGHKVEKLSLPIVIDDSLQKVATTKELVKFLEKIGLGQEIERIKERKIRAGRGKSRGRKYKIKVGPLFVIAQDSGIGKAVKNIPGSNTAYAKNLSAEYLAPGAQPGRLTIFTKSAIAKLGE